MAQTSSLVFAGIAPHPPIMVPEVGRDAIAEVRSSIDAMAALTERVIRSGADTVVIISPHAPLEANAFIAYDGPKLFGDFSNFRAATATVHAELDEELLTEIARVTSEQELPVFRIKGHHLDHGTAVPLYFLQSNGWTGRVIALGYSFLSNEDHVRFGKCVRQAIEQIGNEIQAEQPISVPQSGRVKVKGQRRPPRQFDRVINFMFPLALTPAFSLLFSQS